jgi:salicylate hydroxylase
MLPHHGQGANQAIEDAVTLAACLPGSDPAAALSRYERLRRTRTRPIQRSSWIASDLLHLPDGPRAEHRDRNLAGIDQTLDWIRGHDATAVNAIRCESAGARAVAGPGRRRGRRDRP